MTQHVMYGGDVTIDFNEAKHAYSCEGTFIPGTTTILNILNKPALMPWVAKMCGEWVFDNWEAFTDPEPDIVALVKEMKGHYRKKTEAAADIGTIAHNWIERFIKGSNEEYPDGPAGQSVDAFMEWWQAHKIEVLHSEKVLFSRTHWYAGTVDLIAMVDGVLTLADFKTSSGIYPEMALQLSAYSLAYNEEYNEFPDQRLILRLPKDKPGCEIKAFPNHVQDNEAWLAARELHRWQTRMKEQSK